MGVRIFHVKNLLEMSEVEVEKLHQFHLITFDDGETIESTRNETLYSWYFWSLFKPYPTARITKKHHVHTVLGGKALNADTHRKLCSAILQSIVEDAGLVRPEQKEPLLKAIYKAISDATGRLSIQSEEDVTSIDILDFIQIAKHPVVEGLRAEALLDSEKIKYAYDETIKLIKTDPVFAENGLAKAVKAEMVKDNQVTQCVVFRGIPSEVTGEIFKRPIWSNYTFGNTTLYDFVADSRTAAKSHFYSDTALKDSEYMARKFQLFASSVENVVFEDCGSDRHLTWLVQGPRHDSAGTVIYSGDLPHLVGKYYLDSDTGKYLTIEGNEKHLIGKILKLRTVMYCKTPNKHNVCHVCAGKLSENVSRFANIGHLGSVSTTKDLTQSILSIKHVNTSSTMVKVFLSDHEKQFMNVGPEGTAFFLNANLKTLQPKLMVLREEATGLVDLNDIEDIDGISLQRVSKTSHIMLSTTSNGRPFEVELNVSQKNRPSMLSREMLKYLKEKGWSTNEQNCFVFDMTEWDYSQPMFIMPNKEESFVDMASAVDTLVRSNQKMLMKRLIKDAPAILLQEIFEIMNSKLRVNILSLEIVVYALMVESTTSYAMARNAKDPVLGLGDALTNFRSLGAALAYESQNETLTNPANFFQGRRPDNPMDVFLTPREVVEQYKNR